MILVSTEEMMKSLASVRNFQECILEDVRWRHFGTIVEFVFNYIWADDGSVRSELLAPARKSIVFHNLQELHIVNGLNSYQSLHPVELNWGISEVASVRVIEDEALVGRYSNLPIAVHHIRCSWEVARRIDVVCASIEIL